MASPDRRSQARQRLAADLQVRRLLVRASGRRLRQRSKAPAIRYPTSARVAYHKALVGYVDRAQEVVEQLLAQALPEIVAEADRERGRQDAIRSGSHDEGRFDAAVDLVQRFFGQVTVVLGGTVPEGEARRQATETADRVSQHNRAEVGRQVGAVLGVDPIRSEPYLGPMREAFIAQNVDLIESLTSEQLPELRRLLLSSVRAGKRVEEITAQIEKRFDVSRSKAALIARDQVGKLSGELTEARHRALGLDEYTWDTSQDEKVRPDHAALQGKRFRYSEPPITDRRTGARNNPGQDYQCRCNAIPVIPEELLR